ncbi:MAG: tRNA-dihydrouridine synthase [Pseudomonadales bacterium]|jgi:nifR3 family TIM-barrel protein|nr:tRNA-dihydrouridine synthase [Pseudomonadales bacterium]
MNIWQELTQNNQKILALSPMDGVTNCPMRTITKKYGQPQLIFTEFANVEGLHHAPDRILPILKKTPEQDPVIAQIYGLSPQFFYDATQIICERGFAGVDINMGCPAKNVVQNGAGGGLIKNRELVKEIVTAIKNSVADFAKNNQCDPIPISFKTRLGVHSDEEMEDWLSFLLEFEPANISLHGRTLKQAYSGEANWQRIKDAVKLFGGTSTTIIGNGDIKTHQQALEKIEFSGVNGLLIGRASIGNPFVFNGHQSTTYEMAKIALEHCRFFEKCFKDSPKYNFLPMRTHLASYIKDVAGASQIRSELVQANSADEVEKILESHNLLSK